MTARLLLNENFPIPAITRLRRKGLDLLAIGEASRGLQDEAVLALAVKDQRWLVTFDRDYGELVFGRGLPSPPAIVLLRETHYRPAEPADWVIELLRTPEHIEGQFVVFRRRAVRTRPLLRVL
jgi:predicted nuclease of predicted toxin-antitoxin system